MADFLIVTDPPEGGVPKVVGKLPERQAGDDPKDVLAGVDGLQPNSRYRVLRFDNAPQFETSPGVRRIDV